MKLNDPELIGTPTVGRWPSSFVFKSIHCRNTRCKGCTMQACECFCHDADRQRLAYELSRTGSRRCRTEACSNDARLGSYWCEECNVGMTPTNRLHQVLSKPIY